MPVLLGTQIYIRNCQINYKFARTNALFSAYPWETYLIFGLVSLRKSTGFQLKLDSNKMLKLISLNNRIIYPQSTWMKCSPLLTNAISELDPLLINFYSPTATEKVASG